MTIDTNNTIYTSRSDLTLRINDYRKSLIRWSQLPYNVIVIESSGFGVEPFKDILQNSKNITYISKKIHHIPERGKGYGEANAIKYVMDNIIKENNLYILKMTGRYAPKYKLFSLMWYFLINKIPTPIIKRNHSEWIAANREFFINFTNRCIEICDDRPLKFELFFEGVLMDFVKNNKNVKVSRLLSIPVLPTYTASSNKYVKKI